MSLRRAGLLGLLIVTALVLPAHARAASPTATDKRLARQYERAGSVPARRKALNAILRSLGITVLDARGRVVQRGSAKRGTDPFLYSFEVQILSHASDARPLSKLASLYAAKKVKVRGLVTTGSLGAALRAAVRSARRHPAARGARGVVMIDALARARKKPQDLGSESAADVQLDDLQGTILAADISQAASNRSAHAAVAQTASSNTCFGISERDVSGLEELGEAGDKAESGEGKKFDWRRLPGQVLDVYHAWVISGALSIIQSQPEFDTTHLGPSGHAPDAKKPVHFAIHVISNLPKKSFAARCGPLSGLKFPTNKEPGVKGLETDWDLVGFDNVSDPDVLGDAEGAEETDREGISRFTFTPADEAAPGAGAVRSQTGIVEVVVKTLGPLGNYLGVPTDILGPNRAEFALTLRYHLPAAWHFYAGYLPDPNGGFNQVFHFLDGAECTNDNAGAAVLGPFDPDASWNWAMLSPDGSSVEHFTTGALHAGTNAVGPAGSIGVGSSFAKAEWDDATYWSTSVTWQEASGGPDNYLHAEPVPGFSRAGQNEPTC